MGNNRLSDADKLLADILPMSGDFTDERNYSFVEAMKPEWTKLAELTHSIVLVFDCFSGRFVFVSDHIPACYGLDPGRLIARGHEPLLELIHPDDVRYGLLVRKKIYALLSAMSPEDKMRHKIVHEMRVRNLQGGYVRIIEQERVVALDGAGNTWLMLSVVDADASHESEITKSHLTDFETGEPVFVDLSELLEEPLTNRETEVLRLMNRGLLSKEIAGMLGVSINTVNSHRQKILQKLGANNSIEAVNAARKLGLLGRDK